MTKTKNRFLYISLAFIVLLCAIVLPFTFTRKGRVFADSPANTFVGSYFNDIQFYSWYYNDSYDVENAYPDYYDIYNGSSFMLNSDVRFSFGYHTGANYSDVIVYHTVPKDTYFMYSWSDYTSYNSYTQDITISDIDFQSNGFNLVSLSSSNYILGEGTAQNNIQRWLVPRLWFSGDADYYDCLCFCIIKGDNVSYFSPNKIVGVTFYNGYNLPSYMSSAINSPVLQYDSGTFTSSDLDSLLVGSADMNYIDYFTSDGSHLIYLHNYYENTNGTDSDYLYTGVRTYYFANAYSQSYTNGYNSGYNSGYNEGETAGETAGYSDGYDAGVTVGYNNGYTAGTQFANNYTFEGLITAVIDVPINTIMSMFNFEILGVQLNTFMFAILSICVILAIIRMLKK